MAPHPTDRHLTLDDDLALSLSETGEGRAVLVLHGGGGPATMQPIVAHLAAAHRVLLPTHPGFMGTTRPDSVTSIRDLARTYLALLAAEELRDVVLVGNSIGGWIALEMAVADADGRVGGLVLIDSAGLELPDVPMADFFSLAPDEVARLSFHDPSRSPLSAVTLDDAARAMFASNAATLRALAGDPYMHDPELAPKLGALGIPALVVWGESDGIFPPAYGEAIAGRIPGARFELLPEAGHLPQLERPDALMSLVDGFLATTGR